MPRIACLQTTLTALFLFIASAQALERRPSSSAPAPQQVSDETLKGMARALHRPDQALAKSSASRATPAALAVADALSRVVPGPGIHWNAATGTPRFLDGRSLRRPPAALAKTAAASVKAIAYIHANRDIFKLEEPTRELVPHKEWTDGLGRRHAVFRQHYQGVPVWGREIGVHFDKGGELYALNAGYVPTPRRLGALGYKVGETRAKAVVLADLARRGESGELNEAAMALLEYRGPEAARFVWLDASTGRPHWAWHVSVRPNFRDQWTYFIDGTSGAILERYNATAFDGPATATGIDQLNISRTLNTYKVGNTFYLIDGTRKGFNAKSSLPQDPRGALWTLDAANTDLAKVTQASSPGNTWSDPATVSAHFNMGRVYEYFFGTHGRSGIDGAGSTVISVVHVTEGGKKMDNAYWNGKCMAYGDGDKGFKPLARSLDVAAHEMTHGVIQNTVNLEYKFQSGALNESLADVFGIMVDRDDWLLGEDVVNSDVFPSGALRNMEDPHNGGRGRDDHYWQPSHMNEFVQLNLDQDNGGVHVNSGIPNRAAVLVAKAIGLEKTEKIYYRVMDAHYLNATSQFIDMRLGAIRAAADLHGESSTEVAAVKSAFDAVGIVDKAGTERPKDAPAVEGQELVAIVNAENGDQSLYIARTEVKADTDIVQLTTTQVYTLTGNPIAIPDDGSSLLFIDAQNGLRVIEDGNEEVVSASGNWKSVAISPDGTKVAATTVTPDAKIYILDLLNPDASKTIDLYTPTTGSGIKAENVVNADALDWNSTGQHLLYDAFNRVPNSEGGAIEYWDVNLVDVKTGIITPFYPSLPEGVSIGNPSFAQNSDLNIVFDLFDANNNAYAVLTADLFTGEGTVLDSLGTDYGFPRYSTDDSKVIYEKVESGSRNLVQAPMAANRTARSGPNAAFIKGGQRPTWFAIGKRPAGILSRKPAANALSLSWDPRLGLQYGLPQAARIELTVRDLSGRLLANLEQGARTAGLHRVEWRHNGAPGLYLLGLRARLADGKVLALNRKAVLGR